MVGVISTFTCVQRIHMYYSVYNYACVPFGNEYFVWSSPLVISSYLLQASTCVVARTPNWPLKNCFWIRTKKDILSSPLGAGGGAGWAGVQGEKVSQNSSMSRDICLVLPSVTSPCDAKRQTFASIIVIVYHHSYQPWSWVVAFTYRMNAEQGYDYVAASARHWK